MGSFEAYKPALAMLFLQFCYGIMSLFNRAALLQGIRPSVSVFYRQSFAFFSIAPFAYFSRTRTKSKSKSKLTFKSSSLIFLAALFGATMNQNLYYKGLLLSSTAMGSAMSNLIPAITFVMAAIVGLEKIKVTSPRSIAKITGTLLCVGGAICMAFLKGSELLLNSAATDRNWLLGSLLLFLNSSCWSLWLIIQVPLSDCYPDHLSSSAWMGLFGMIQSAVVAIFLEPNFESWILHTKMEYIACSFAGVASGVSYFVQAWCIQKRGPLYSAMFNPLSTVVATAMASVFLHESIYTGSLVGALAVIIGLYIVLWGKAGESNRDDTIDLQINVDEKTRSRSDLEGLEEPLLSDIKSVDEAV